MRHDPPKSGRLSGMILPIGALATVLVLASVSPGFREPFLAPVAEPLRLAFLGSIGVMFLHKIESYWTEEYDHCPVYLDAGGASWARSVRQSVFVSFVGTFLGMLLVVFLAMSGPPWHLLILTAWLGQGLHELHHAAKALNRRAYYPGLITSLVFVGSMGLWFYPCWYDQVVGGRQAGFYAYYVLAPLVLTLFYVEDRSWYARAGGTVAWQAR